MVAGRRATPGYILEEARALEEISPFKLELVEGKILAMGRASPRHAALTMEIGGLLRDAIRGGPGQGFGASLAVGLASGEEYVHPDTTVVCGPPARHPRDSTVLVNPTAVFEVTSPSTEGYDRGEKLEKYRQIPSLQTTVLIAQTERAIEVIARDGARWARSSLGPGDRVELDLAQLDVDAVYDAVRGTETS